jgi:DNA-binding Lrp family transcriptional regulator
MGPADITRPMREGSLERRDVALLHVLMRDSRGTEQQVSGITGMTSEEVAKRTDAMMEAGVIRSFTTKPSLTSLGAISVLVYGKSRLSTIEEAKDQLISNDRVAWAALSGAGRLYVALHLIDLKEKDAQLRKVEGKAMLIRPSAAVRDLFCSRPCAHDYDQMEWGIVRSLSKDSRKPVEEVARELGRTVEEVDGRLRRMMQDGLLDFSIEFDPNQCANPMCLFHVETVEPHGLEDRVRTVMERNAPALLFFNTYSNVGNLMTAMALPQDFEDLRAIMRSLRREGGFGYVEANPILASCLMDTWRDRMIIEKGGPARRKR